MVPGPSFTAEIGAVLLDTAEPRAADLLERLVAVHLIERQSPGRYGFHDLLRDYAAEQLETTDSQPTRQNAAGMLARHYLARADSAADEHFAGSLRLPTSAPPKAPFHDRAAALAWLDAGRANLVAAAVRCASEGPLETAWLLGTSRVWRTRCSPKWAAVPERSTG